MDNINVLVGIEFVKFLNRYFDDYDNDNYKRMLSNYPELKEEFLCRMFKSQKT